MRSTRTCLSLRTPSEAASVFFRRPSLCFTLATPPDSFQRGCSSSHLRFMSLSREAGTTLPRSPLLLWPPFSCLASRSLPLSLRSRSRFSPCRLSAITLDAGVTRSSRGKGKGWTRRRAWKLPTLLNWPDPAETGVGRSNGSAALYDPIYKWIIYLLYDQHKRGRDKSFGVLKVWSGELLCLTQLSSKTNCRRPPVSAVSPQRSSASLLTKLILVSS